MDLYRAPGKLRRPPPARFAAHAPAPIKAQLMQCPFCASAVKDLRRHIKEGGCPAASASLVMELQMLSFGDVIAAGRGPRETLLLCSACGRRVTRGGVILLENCSHRLCPSCVDELVAASVALWVCPAPQCGLPITQSEVSLLSTSHHEETAAEKQLLDYLSCADHNIVQCPRCTVRFEFALSEGAANERGHMNSYRVRCLQCDAIFCASCYASPYHDDEGCADFARRSSKCVLTCRFCGVCLAGSGEARTASIVDRILGRRPPPVDCCSKAECLTLGRSACNATLPCGHPCYLSPDAPCGPCLVQGCRAAVEGSSRDDFCAICYVDELRWAPCIPMSCGHVFHVACWEARLARRWQGHRIAFNYLDCPLCNYSLQLRDCKWASEEFTTLLRQHLDNKVLVEQKMLQRLQLEGLEDDPALTDPVSPYYQQKLSFASKILAFYECFQCRRAYFGGLQRCEVADDEANDAKGRENLICPGCTPASERTRCAAHGTDYIVFKCRFCCSVATYFCWGKTHFCTSCHERQDRGEFLTRMPASAHPVCHGKERCPLKIDHPPNGTKEFALGCSYCQDEATSLPSVKES